MCNVNNNSESVIQKILMDAPIRVLIWSHFGLNASKLTSSNNTSEIDILFIVCLS